MKAPTSTPFANREAEYVRRALEAHPLMLEVCTELWLGFSSTDNPQLLSIVSRARVAMGIATGEKTS
jgi:hypothetical protein